MRILSGSVKQTLSIGRGIAGNLQAGDIICLFGNLGSGKTVLTKGIAEGIGLNKKDVISPSFVLIREYKDARLPLYHFDLYRLDKQREIYLLGYEEYFYGDGVSVVEWADRLGNLLPGSYLRIELRVKAPTKRELKISGFGKRHRQLREMIDEDISS